MMLAPHQEFLKAVRRDKPDITLQGLCDRLAAERGVKTYTSVMSRFLRHLGVTLKKRRSSPVSKIGLT
jgi:transposase